MSRTTFQIHVARARLASAVSVVLLLALALTIFAPSAVRADTFTLDPLSPTLPLIPAGPADLLWDVPGAPAPGFPPPPSTGIPFAALGLGLFGPGDVVNAISDGFDPVFLPHTDYFSVTRGSVGAPGSGVFVQSSILDTPPGFTPGHAGDLFVTSPPLLGTNILAPAGFGWTLGSTTGDEFNAGLITPTFPPALGPPGDNVNAYDLATMGPPGPASAVFFSLAAGSPTLAGLGFTAADVLAVGGPFGPVPVVFVPAIALGLPLGVAFDMDALAIAVGPGFVFLGPGSIEYSLTAATAALIGLSGADILGLGVGAVVTVPHPFGTIGLLATDDLDALDVGQQILVPEPSSMALLGLGALALAWPACRRGKRIG